MSDPTMTGMTENVPGTSGPPPIATLLPVLQLVLAGSSLLFRLGVRFLRATVYPLCIIWSFLQVLLSPITTVVQITLDMVLFTPFSIFYRVAFALYPIYVFCAVACIVGAAFGMFGHYLSTTILSVLARSTYFTRPPSPPTAPPSGPQAMLRKRKRRSVRVQ